MTVPRELSLVKTAEGFRINQLPVPELSKLRKGPATTLQARDFSNTIDIDQHFVQKELELSFDPGKSTANQFGFSLSNSKGEVLVIGYDKIRKEVYIDRTNSGKTSFSTLFPKKHTAPLDGGNLLQIHALVDASSIEIFVNNGSLAMTDIFFPNEDYNRVQLFSTGGSTHLISGSIWELRSIWR